MLIESLAPMLMIGGILVVLLALGPVRRSFTRLTSRLERASRQQIVLVQEKDVRLDEMDRFDIESLYQD